MGLGEGCQAAGSPRELLKVPMPDTHLATHVSQGWPEKQNPQDAWAKKWEEEGAGEREVDFKELAHAVCKD